MQKTDGNLVIYDGHGFAKAISGVRGAGAYLAVQDDGNVVVYPGKAGYSPWSTQTQAAMAGTCYQTANYRTCLTSVQGYRLNQAASSSNRAYSCVDFALGPTQCLDHEEGSYWNSAAGAWEDYVNTAYSTFAAPALKNCVYIRLDIAPNGHSWVSAWQNPIPQLVWTPCPS
jgi:hypothetical protein